MAGLLFGTGGIPISTRMPLSTTAGIERIKELGLDCMEIQFVQGVRMSGADAYVVGETAFRLGVKLSAHAPFFINFGSRDRQELMLSQQRLVETAHIASLFLAQNVTFHAAFYLGDSPKKTYHNVKKYLGETLDKIREEGKGLRIRPEITGKSSQFGTLEEVLNLSTDLEGVAPCLNFAHLHSRTEQFNSYLEFATALQQVKERLGRTALDDIYIRVCGISYEKGEEAKEGRMREVRHLNLSESDFKYAELLQALKDFDAKGTVICDSPNLEEDALLLKATYESLPLGEEPVIVTQLKEEKEKPSIKPKPRRRLRLRRNLPITTSTILLWIFVGSGVSGLSLFFLNAFGVTNLSDLGLLGLAVTVVAHVGAATTMLVRKLVL